MAAPSAPYEDGGRTAAPALGSESGDSPSSNDRQWDNEDHWAGPGIYFSKADTRLWVPKKVCPSKRTACCCV